MIEAFVSHGRVVEIQITEFFESDQMFQALVADGGIAQVEPYQIRCLGDQREGAIRGAGPREIEMDNIRRDDLRGENLLVACIGRCESEIYRE